MEMMVYFNNGQKARFDAEKATFAVMHGQSNDRFDPDVEGGRTVINWDSVAFVREFEIRGEEDDE